MTMGDASPNQDRRADPTLPRVFLVVVDETDEWKTALRYACRRAAHTNGHVALLHVVEPAEFQHWTAVEDVIREESRQQGEQLLQKAAKDALQLSGRMPILFVREGNTRDELLALIDEEPSISNLVLGANPGSEGPGPLIQFLTSKRMGQLRIPVTMVPGGLTDEQIDLIG